MTTPGRRRWRAWGASTGFTLALAALVAAAVADRGTLFPLVVFGAAALGLGALYVMFPRGIHFAFGTASGFAVYACIYEVLGRSGFPAAEGWARAPAFLLPVLAFLAAVWARRADLREIAEHQETLDLDHLPAMARWLIMVSLVGVASLSVPINRMTPEGQGLALLAAMGWIAVMVAISVEDVVRFLVDIALLMEDLAARSRRLVIPIATFLSLYSLMVVVFACLYRIADGVSQVPLFAGPGGAIRMDFASALHFSIVTLSTVGYGDIHPSDDGVRLLSGAEVVMGQVLLLFGFAEIMRSRRVRSDPPG